LYTYTSKYLRLLLLLLLILTISLILSPLNSYNNTYAIITKTKDRRKGEEEE